MARRAVIYIRTSSEMQGKKSRPTELAQEKGLNIIRVYRDYKKYRVGNRLIAFCSGRQWARAMVGKKYRFYIKCCRSDCEWICIYK